LQADASESAPRTGISGGKQERDPRRDGNPGFTTAFELIAIVERKISNAGRDARDARVRVCKRIAQLVSLARNRPFLREGVEPLTIRSGSAEGVDVLYHTELLVVRLLNKETVVLDRRGLRARVSPLAGGFACTEGAPFSPARVSVSCRVDKKANTTRQAGGIVERRAGFERRLGFSM